LHLWLTLALLNSFFTSILQSGVHESQSSLEQRKIQVVNALNLLLAISVLTGTFFNFQALGSKLHALPALGFFILALASLFLNNRGFLTVSMLLFTFNLNLAILYANETQPFNAGPYLYYFPLIVCVVLMNNQSFRDKFSFIHLGIAVGFFLIHFVIDIPRIHLVDLTAEQHERMWLSNLCLSILATMGMTLLLTSLISKQNNEIIGQNESLKKAKQAVNNTLKEKEILLAELHHRVKNNLAIISGLLNLQSDATSSDEARQVISDSKNRILSMALVHRMLFENPALKSINLSKYSSELIMELFRSYNLEKYVDLTEEYDHAVLQVSKSIPLGLILNEIVTNSIKYAFKANPKQKGQFYISIKNLPDSKMKLVVKDNGKGFPENYNFDHPSLSLGIFLMKTLAEQIDGEVKFSNDNGARIELTFTTN
jgi:two-component sensor histidine kinase